MNRITEFPFFKGFFLIIVLIHILFIAPVGFDYTDGTYILNLAGLNSNSHNALYSDLNYIRPPGSIWLHSIDFIFGDFSLLWSRVFYFIQLAISSLLMTLIILKVYQSNLIGTGFLWATAALVYLLSTFFFPPMAWHTVDGVFLIVLGFYLYNRGNYIVSSPLILWGILCKQSFYPIIIIFVFIVILSDLGRQAKLKVLFSLTASFGLFCLVYVAQNRFTPFVYSTFLQTQSKDLLRAGVWEYFFKLKEPINIVMMSMVLPWPFLRYKFRFLAFVSILIYLLIEIILIKNWVVPSFHFGLFFLSIIFFLFSIIRRKQNNLFFLSVLFFLTLSWCSSISWGYRSPQFAAAPLILFFLPTLEIAYIKRQFAIILVFLTATNLLTFKFPYRSGGSYYEHVKNMQTAPLGIKNLKGILISNVRKNELTQIQKLVELVPTNEPVLFGPSFTAGYLCFNRFSGQGITWPIDVELGFGSDSISVKLDRINYSVLKAEKNQYIKCTMCNMVEKSWNVVSCPGSFCLYSRN